MDQEFAVSLFYRSERERKKKEESCKRAGIKKKDGLGFVSFIVSFLYWPDLIKFEGVSTLFYSQKGFSIRGRHGIGETL